MIHPLWGYNNQLPTATNGKHSNYLYKEIYKMVTTKKLINNHHNHIAKH